MKKEHKNLVTLIKVLVTIIHLQVLLPIKIGYLLLTNCHLTLSGDSTSQTVHYIINFLFSQNSWLCCYKAIDKQSETSEEVLTKKLANIDTRNSKITLQYMMILHSPYTQLDTLKLSIHYYSCLYVHKINNSGFGYFNCMHNFKTSQTCNETSEICLFCYSIFHVVLSTKDVK